ncbi:amino acid/amide ABC transporter membrane protein 1, HAAT family [Desulfonispora thiosulfatigenes DSM 11270]|uniref:Amino acid/amide ABC transporter membrane protein 1, HAAT family n=1 Tax=Desulfonispora thiosulfatigenes DSM 11270 TaxID=656914 RepID=A0A1W1VMW6_DESTI|nr:branched-chain amino acid ABC transporter permease [Desulfonispora thiosulfatigenes]SMB94666.1 amino acid/amide ABC transporter membrane protein 1, HAAT family [Desulfonispora thiosulfatigenes DSM 11270]
MVLDNFLQNLANGISLGSLYALIAIGYTLVYGILRLINFAHGDIFMISAYVAIFGFTVFNLPWYISFLLAIVITSLIGVGIEKAAYRPLRTAPRISVLISAIGISFLLQNLGMVIFSGRPRTFPTPDIFGKMLTFGNVKIMSLTFIIPIVTAICLIILNFLISKTKMGMAMRAVSKDFETSRLMGIDVDKVVSFTFIIGSALAAVGGIMWGMKYPRIDPLLGVMPGLKCFIAAVVGGIGSVTGATIGGFILGLGEILLVAFLPALSGYRDAFAFILLIVILLFKPTGIIGEKTTEKV